MNPSFLLEDYHYELPEDRIARYPLEERSASKLLVYNNGEIHHSAFRDLPDILPPNSLLVFNNSRVIPARLHLTTSNGKHVEVMLLHPVFPHKDPLLCLGMLADQVWECMVGNRKAWKQDEELKLTLFDGVEVSFSWADRDLNWIRILVNDADLNMADLLKGAGEIPLPPYLNRKAEAIDEQRYQTVYAAKSGSVAAPTAGLHFDEQVLKELESKGHRIAKIALHVGAGTFLPVKTDNMLDHTMHAELFELTADFLQILANHKGPVIAVGTTSLRALESIPYVLDGQHLNQMIPQFPDTVPELDLRLVCQRILAVMRNMNISSILGETQIMIYPGFKLKCARGIVTNFHQPGSTLLLLISALVGEDWKRIYSQALDNDYRFLSYGDSSLLLWA